MNSWLAEGAANQLSMRPVCFAILVAEVAGPWPKPPASPQQRCPVRVLCRAAFTGCLCIASSLNFGKDLFEMPGNGCSASDGDTDKAATLGGSRVPLTVAGTEEALVRVPGVALLFSDTVTEVPAVFTHMLRNLPAMYETVILVTVRCAAPCWSGQPGTSCPPQLPGCRPSSTRSPGNYTNI